MIDFNQWFLYDETSVTCIRWKVDIWSGENYSVKRISCGEVAGSFNKKGYCNVILKGVSYRVHRVIWEMLVGNIPPKLQIDHINKNRADNKISNLRLVTNALNKRNSNIYSNNKTGVTGVRWITMNNTLYACATWATIDFERKAAYFSAKKYGKELAFEMACERRQKEIKLLNLNNAGYLENHGK